MAALRSAAGALLLLWPSFVAAEPRPTARAGFWSFSPEDEVVFHEPDGSGVRVHYSVMGPNAVLADDDDGDGVPDFVALAHARALESRTRFAALGLRAPLDEAAIGPALDGSPAFDLYLLDFGGAADGRFGVDGCTSPPQHCAGFLVVENDFDRYGYPSIEAALDTVVSHEMFHAVQAAYAPLLPVWASEGTAVWAERRFRSDSLDFLHQCEALLEDHERSLFRPPPGPVPAFAYGSALWWEYLGSAYGHERIHDILVGVEARPRDAAQVERIVQDVLAEQRIDLAHAWARFAELELATGTRAGAIAGLDFAAELDGIVADASGAALDLDVRLYPLAASFWQITHRGGPLWFASDVALTDVRFSLHASAGVEAPVEEASMRWSADGSAIELGDRAAGTWWIVATLPVIADEAARARVCIGDAAVIECVPAASDGTSGTTDESDTSSNTAAETTTGEASGDSESGSAATDMNADGCGCRQHGEDPSGLAALALLAARRRRGPE